MDDARTTSWLTRSDPAIGPRGQENASPQAVSCAGLVGDKNTRFVDGVREHYENVIRSAKKCEHSQK